MDSSIPHWGVERDIEAVITNGEINPHHGTGALLLRVLHGRRNLVSIRSHDTWGEQKFGDWRMLLSHSGRSRMESFEQVLEIFAGRRVHSALCVPFESNELITAIALQEIFGARLAGWIMDDQNISVNTIPDTLMREFLRACSLRLATHPELRRAYEDKYGLPFYLLPAVAPAELIVRESSHATMHERRAALIGSFWDQSWFDRLCEICTGSGWDIDWFGNNHSPFLVFPEAKLQAARIHARGVIPEHQLAAELQSYPLAIVPAGALDTRDASVWMASLSLPGRIIFAAAVARTPTLMVGSPKTCGARFIEHFQIGETVPYDAAAFRDALARLADPVHQRSMRGNAGQVAESFSDREVGEWLRQSLQCGHPADSRFEDAFACYAYAGSR